MNALVVSGLRSIIDQHTIWPWIGDRTITSPASVRTQVGAFFEEATRRLCGASPHTTDGNADVCPDLSHSANQFLEVKSLSTSSAYIFQHRLVNDRLLCDQTFGTMVYVYWLHTARVTRARSRHQLRRMLAASIGQVLVIPAERLWAASARMRTFQLRYRADGGRMPAYRFSRAQLLEMARGRVELPCRVGSVLGTPVGTVRVHGPDLGRLFPPLTMPQRQRAEELLAELSAHQLTVALLPAPRPQHQAHQVRTVLDCNPTWYSMLCRRYPKKRSMPRQRGSRYVDSDIRRPQVLRALERLAQGTCRYEYDWRLRPFLGG